MHAFGLLENIGVPVFEKKKKKNYSRMEHATSTQKGARQEFNPATFSMSGDSSTH